MGCSWCSNIDRVRGMMRMFGIAGLLSVALAVSPVHAHPLPRSDGYAKRDLRDRARIEDAIVGLANATDGRDWDAAKAVLADQVLLEYHIAGSAAAPIAQSMTADQFIAASKSVLPGYLHTQHLVGNMLVSVKGDGAVATSQVWMSHYLPNDQGEPYWNVAGTYRHELVRTKAGWRISAMRVNILYEMGNTRLSKLAGERVKAGIIMTTP